MLVVAVKISYQVYDVTVRDVRWVDKFFKKNTYGYTFFYKQPHFSVEPQLLRLLRLHVHLKLRVAQKLLIFLYKRISA